MSTALHIARALQNLRPSAQWSLTGTDLATLDWLDTEQDRPSDEEIAAEADRLAALPEPVLIGYAAFRSRWTDPEKAALHGARAVSWQIDDFISLATANGNIDLSIANEAKAAFVAAGVLTQERADEIFSAEG